MRNKKIKAFTLVELIVVIIIIAILGTIAFISLQGYSESSRNSVRISDLSNLKTSLELFHIDAGKYPLPSDSFEVTYSGGEVWTQGIFGISTFTNVGKLNKIPLDPLYDTEYAYSILNSSTEYELAGVMEGNEFTYSPKQVNAVDKILMTVKVTGNYNGETLQVNRGGEDCIIATPSIITSSGITLENIISNNYLVYDNYKNLPSNFINKGNLNILGENNLKIVNESNIELHCGNIEELKNNETVRINFIDNFQKAYSGTQVEKSGNIGDVLSLDIDKANPSQKVRLFTINFIEEEYNLEVSDSQMESISDCYLPWGGSISNNQSVTAYLESSVACGLNCTSETRTCTNGILSGSYTNSSCNPQVCPPDCRYNLSNPKTYYQSADGGFVVMYWDGTSIPGGEINGYSYTYGDLKYFNVTSTTNRYYEVCRTQL